VEKNSPDTWDVLDCLNTNTYDDTWNGWFSVDRIKSNQTFVLKFKPYSQSGEDTSRIVSILKIVDGYVTW